MIVQDISGARRVFPYAIVQQNAFTPRWDVKPFRVLRWFQSNGKSIPDQYEIVDMSKDFATEEEARAWCILEGIQPFTKAEHTFFVTSAHSAPIDAGCGDA